jgi:ElaB/YqjD/DUF883 family membrane-anchored ribosome-binding protein
MSLSSSTNRRLEDTQAQIDRLRQEVEAMMKDRITPAVSNFADQAQERVSNASRVVKDQSRYVSGRVKERPLIAVGIAAVVGWVIGRLMR